MVGTLDHYILVVLCSVNISSLSLERACSCSAHCLPNSFLKLFCYFVKTNSTTQCFTKVQLACHSCWAIHRRIGSSLLKRHGLVCNYGVNACDIG